MHMGTQVLGEQIQTHEYLFPLEITTGAFSLDGIRQTPDSIFGNTLFVAIDPCSGGAASMIGVAIVYYPPRANHVTVLLHSCM